MRAEWSLGGVALMLRYLSRSNAERMRSRLELTLKIIIKELTKPCIHVYVQVPILKD